MAEEGAPEPTAFVSGIVNDQRCGYCNFPSRVAQVSKDPIHIFPWKEKEEHADTNKKSKGKHTRSTNARKVHQPTPRLRSADWRLEVAMQSNAMHVGSSGDFVESPSSGDLPCFCPQMHPKFPTRNWNSLHSRRGKKKKGGQRLIRIAGHARNSTKDIELRDGMTNDEGETKSRTVRKPAWERDHRDRDCYRYRYQSV